MKKHLLAPLIPILALSIMTFSARSQDNPLFRHIPPDAGSVYRINLGAIAAKIGWEDLVKTLPLEKMKLGAFQDAITDPGSAGINLHGDFIIATPRNEGPDSPRFSMIIFPILDSSKFSIFVRKLMPDARIRRNPDKSYSAAHKQKCVSWNNQLAVITDVKPPVSEAMAAWQDKSKEGKSEPGRPKPKAPDHLAEALHKSLAALKGFGDNYYTTDPVFKAQFSNEGDIQMCNEHGSYLKGLSKMIPHGAMGGMDPDAFDVFDKKFTEIRFENGGLSVRGRLILKPDMAASLEKYHAPAFNNDLVARIPKGSLLGLVSLRIDLSMFGDMMKKFGMSQKFDSAMAAKGIALGDLGKALKGDFLLAVLGTEKKDSAGKPKPDIYFVAPINDMSALHNLGMELMKAAAKDSATAAADTSKHKKHDGMRHIVEHSAVHDDLLVISGSKEGSEAFFSNTEKRNTDFLTDDLRQSPSFIWIDLKAVISYISNALAGQPNQEKTRAILDKLSVLDKLVISGGSIHNGEINTSFELRTSDPNENILKTLMNIAH